MGSFVVSHQRNHNHQAQRLLFSRRHGQVPAPALIIIPPAADNEIETSPFPARSLLEAKEIGVRCFRFLHGANRTTHRRGHKNILRAIAMMKSTSRMATRPHRIMKLRTRAAMFQKQCAIEIVMGVGARWPAQRESRFFARPQSVSAPYRQLTQDPQAAAQSGCDTGFNRMNVVAHLCRQ